MSGTNIGNYVSTYACSNLTAGSSTVFPASGTGTTVSVTPAVDDQISCTFTNAAETLDVVPISPTKAIMAGATANDIFKLVNTSSNAGTFTVAMPTLTTSTGGTITPSAYTVNGTTYPTFAAAQLALSQITVASNANAQFGVIYAEPTTPGTTVTISLSATVSAQGATSNPATGVETDTSSAVVLTVSKTVTTAASPGGPIGYSILVANSTQFSGDNAIFSDPLPTGMSIVGTPTCLVTSGAATCGAVNVAGNAVSSTITKLPANSSVTFSITGSSTTAGSYVNTASATTAGTSGATATSSLTTVVAASNGLQKSVRNVTNGDPTGASASPQDVLEYTIRFTNSTSVALSSFVVNDATPTNTSFVSAACGPLPTGISSCSVSAPSAGATGAVRWTFVGSLASGDTITAVLRVRVD